MLIKMCNEMLKLRSALDKAGISWTDRSTVVSEEHVQRIIAMGIEREYAETSVYRTFVDYKGHTFSIIHGWGTWGGFNPDSCQDDGLLEVSIDCKEPEGWLTTEDVISLMRGFSTLD